MLAARGAAAASLNDLGFPRGITLRGSDAEASVYFPLPPRTRDASLALEIALSATLERGPVLTIEANGAPIATLMANAAGKPVTVSLPIAADPELGRQDFVKVTFVAAGRREGNCADGAADWLRIGPATALNAVGGPETVGSAWRMLRVPATIALPEPPSRADIEAALILSTALVERGTTPSITNSVDASVRIGSATADGAAAKAAVDPAAELVTTPSGRPQIVIATPGAARALVLAAAFANASATSRTTAGYAPDPSPSEPAAPATLTLGALGVASKTIAFRQAGTVPIPLHRVGLPAGRRVAAILLDGQSSALPAGQALTATLLVGDAVVWSRSFRERVVLEQATIALPPRLLAAGAPVRLRLTRFRGTAACAIVPAVSFTLFNSTALRLAEGQPRPTRFAGFSPAGFGPVPVVTDLPPARIAPAVALIAELLGSHGVNPAAITLGATNVQPTRPFVLIAEKAGGIVATAPLPDPRGDPARGAVVLALPNQRAALSLPDVARDSVLQLVATKANVPGLWLAPGPAASLASPTLPGEGDIAFYRAGQASATFATVRQSADFAPRTAASFFAALARWRSEIFIVVWLLIALAVVVVVTRRRGA